MFQFLVVEGIPEWCLLFEKEMETHLWKADGHRNTRLPMCVSSEAREVFGDK